MYEPIIISKFASPWRMAALALALAGVSAACSDRPALDGEADEASAAAQNLDGVGTTSQALSVDDGLAEAYALFKTQFTSPGLAFDKTFPIGYGFHPGLSTETLKATNGHTPKGQAKIKFAVRDAQGLITTNGSVTATLEDAPAGQTFDLWFVKNIAGSGRTVRPETGDSFKKVGSFNGPATPTGGKSLSVVISRTANTDLDKFDLDLVVVTRGGQHPSTSRIALGARTLLEKRFFRERAGQALDPVPSTALVSNTVETTDRLVKRGSHLFFNETFAGNGRTCGTCHRAENNLTIDPDFIKTLPATDPLFVAERNSALTQLEDSAMLRSRGLNRENLDGFDKAPVLRSVQHTFALSATIGMEQAVQTSFPMAPPDHRLGWSGDGAPGRGTLNEFSFGAIIQHFPKDLRHRPGIDFRIPTQEELDALEAFQLFSGRQKLVDGTVLRLKEPRAESGRTLFLTPAAGGKCTNCHLDMGSINNFSPLTINFVLATGARDLTPELPNDNGFLAVHPAQSFLLGDGSFNVPPVIEAADTAPFFHNNSRATIEDAVAFYTTAEFRNAPNGDIIDLTQTQIDDIGAFLRVLNAAENIRQVRKRVEYVRNNRSAGNTAILTIAIADTQDALDVLSAKNLNQAARNNLSTVKLTLETARSNADADRPPHLDSAITWLNLAKTELFTDNPANAF